MLSAEVFITNFSCNLQNLEITKQVNFVTNMKEYFVEK